MSNGETINPKLATEDNRISQWLTAELGNDQMIDALFKAALARQPSADEKERLLGVMSEYPETERRQAIEDVCWSVLTSGEFIFNQ
jgi:hypothetical protein